jgi:IS30 family transposase
MNRKPLHDSTHLTLDERKIIEAGITNNSTKAAIAKNIGKDATTVAKEIRKHRIFKARNTYNRPVMCEKLRVCTHKPCLEKCEFFMEPKCNRRDKSPGACNGCEKASKCHYDKYFYKAEIADEEYRRDLVDYRSGINLTTKERDSIANTIAPLLKQGQSVHQILSAHSELGLSQRTLYAYIQRRVFKDFGVDNFSLKEQVNRKQFKEKYKKRREPSCFNGRKYADFLKFREENPETPVTQMDTVYNDPSGPYLQTFMVEKANFMFGFLHDEKTSESMARRVDWLQEVLGAELFSKIFPAVLTDRGSEFEKWQLFELDSSGRTRLNIFYCDPMQSSQKACVENNHNYVRDIIPNGYPIGKLSLNDINLMFSNINATPRLSLNDKSPFEVFSFFYGEKTANALGISKINRDDVVLKPYLIFRNK